MRPRGRPRAAAVVMSALMFAGAATVVASPQASASDYDGRSVLSSGHVDVFDARYVDDELVLFVNDGTQDGEPVVRTPADVVLHVTDASRIDMPASLVPGLPGFAEQNAEIWVLPQINTGGQLFAGWATEHIAPGTLQAGSRVTFTIEGVQGPGNFALWQTGVAGIDPKANSADGVPDAFHTATTYAHDHGNWAFSAEGEYVLEVAATAVLADGTTVTSEAVPYTFYVGDDLPTGEDEELTVSIGNWREFYIVNENHTITAVHPDDDRVAGYRWWQYIRATLGSTGEHWEGWLALGSERDFTLLNGVDDDGGEVYVELLDAGGNVIATSERREVRILAEEAPVEGLSIVGLRHHYHSTETANLQAQVFPSSFHSSFRWSTQRGDDDWVVVPGAATDKYSFPVGPHNHGLDVKVELLDDDGAVVLESAPVTVMLDDHGAEPPASQLITASLPVSEGALLISVDPAERDVVLSDFALNPEADRLVASGQLAPVAVVDTRSADAGWSVMGRTYQFVSVDGDTLAGEYLGWRPTVLSQSDGQEVAPGPDVPTGFESGTGLRLNQVLGSAESDGNGRAELGAELTLDAPLDLVPATYTGLLVFTVI